MISKYLGISAAIAVAALLTGCITESSRAKVQIESEKVSWYRASPKKIYVIADLGPAYPHDKIGPDGFVADTPFGDQFSSALLACGIFVDFVTADNTVPRNITEARMKAFRPDVTMVIQRVEVESYMGTPVAGSYVLKMAPVGSSVVWKADLRLNSGFYRNPALVKSIVNQLVSDEILPKTCSI